ETVEIDLRIIAATNRNLRRQIGEGHFREDLFYRLSVFPIEVPSLRERAEDVPVLAAACLERKKRKMSTPVEGFSPAVLARLCDYSWPGNVRELENIIEYALIFAKGLLIELEHLPPSLRSTP